MTYVASYEDSQIGSQVICSNQDLSIEEAFSVATQEAANAFFANGGNSYSCTDTSYAVQPESYGHEYGNQKTAISTFQS